MMAAETKYSDMDCSVGSTTDMVAVSEEVKKYYVRAQQFARAMDQKKKSGTNREKAPPKLTELCCKAIAGNFSQKPLKSGETKISQDQLPCIMAELPMNLDLSVAARHVDNESYWKRRCLHCSSHWRPFNIRKHGGTWKQYFLERCLEEALENFDHEAGDPEALLAQVEFSRDYVFQLTLKELASHIDLNILFSQLHNLSSFSLTYGARNIGMAYERSIFGMKAPDAVSIANCITSTQTLVSLSLPSNMIDDELLGTLVQGLQENRSIVHIDLSHNEIANLGARLLAGLIENNPTISSLILSDNKIHADGGSHIGRALMENSTLEELDLRLNRLSDRGGAKIFDGLAENDALQSLNLSCNSLSSSSCKKCADYVQFSGCALRHLDISCNDLNANDMQVLLRGMESNSTIRSIDIRQDAATSSSSPSECSEKICEIVRRNELAFPRSKGI